MKKVFLLGIISVFMVGCSIKTNTEDDSAKSVFITVNDAMLQGNLDTALMYVCKGTEPTPEQMEVLQVSLDMIPQELKDSITYTVDSVEDKETYSEVVATMTLDGESQTQVAKIYHKPSAKSANYCVDMTETAEPELEKEERMEESIEPIESMETVEVSSGTAVEDMPEEK